MVRRRRKLITTTFLSLIVVSCTDDFKVVPVENDGTELVFYNDGLLWDTRITPCLRELILFAETFPLTVAWQLRAEEQNCIHVQSIVIGQVPLGFSETTPMATLARGTRVRVSASDGNGRGGSSDTWAF